MNKVELQTNNQLIMYFSNITSNAVTYIYTTD